MITHPVLIQDVAQAVAWAHDHIAEHGGDAAQLFLTGHSAGAQLVALLGTPPWDKPQVNLVVFTQFDLDVDGSLSPNEAEAVWLAGHDGGLFAAIGHAADQPGSDPAARARSSSCSNHDNPLRSEYSS